ncbi:MAG: substrate-binding domain-containing protein [Gemmatimonadales bacterium]
MCGALAACTTREPPLRFGTTYTVQQSGALAVVESLWTARRGADPLLRTVIGPSGLILRSAAAGDLDVVLTHAPSLERRLLSEGRAGELVRARCPLMASRFALVGPERDLAGVRNARSAAAALRALVRSGALFVSRGDSSGTHTKERELWERAGITPGGDWYFEAGSDQASTLRMAEEWGAYALADLPTIARIPNLSLAVLFTADTALRNPYTLYLVASAPPAADRFARWLADSGSAAAATSLRLPDSTPAFELPPEDSARALRSGCTQ